MRKCPYCEGEIEDDAFICRHCGREATAIEEASKPAAPPANISSPKVNEDISAPPLPLKTPPPAPLKGNKENNDKTGWIIAGVIGAVVLFGSCLCLLVMFVPVILGMSVQ